MDKRSSPMKRERLTPRDNLLRLSERLGLATFSDLDLLQTHAAILEELRRREISRTSNNPVSDYTEWLVCSKLGLELATNSTTGFDAVAEDGIHYEIKSRRVTSHSSSVQLSAIRNLKAAHFDYLIGVIYEVDFTIRYAAKIPHAAIESVANYRTHTNAHVLNLNPSVLELPSVEDITDQLRAH